MIILLTQSRLAGTRTELGNMNQKTAALAFCDELNVSSYGYFLFLTVLNFVFKVFSGCFMAVGISF